MDKKEKHKIRRNARSKLDKILKEQNYRCAYCQRYINRIKNITKEKIICEKYLEFTIRDKKDKQRRIFKATIDHKKRLSDGGTNNRENLVACCIQCNQDQNRKFFPKSKYSWYCECGKRKRKKKSKQCPICYKIQFWNWFIRYLKDNKNDYY